MIESYRNEREFPFCPGCGHALILNALDRALVSLQLDPRRVLIVSDIGCHGLGDQFFATHTFHGLHGRSIAYATGAKLIDPGLHVVVLIGDGGVGIGAAHLLAAARRNVGLTVLVFNNFNFGMTGGEHSVTTPTGGITATTRAGNLERPLDLCATVGVCGAAMAWRGTAFDRELSSIIVEAIGCNGFALLDIWELCTAYYAPQNDLSRRSLTHTREALQMPEGIVARSERPEYAAALREMGAAQFGQAALQPTVLMPRFHSALNRQIHLVIAGSAGGKVRSAARIVSEAAVLSGLRATQTDSYPVTVKSGHSISEVCLSRSEIFFTGCSRPDVLVVASEAGYRAAPRYLATLTPESALFVTEEHAGIHSDAQKTVLELDALAGSAGRQDRALLMVGAAVRELELLPIEACESAIRLAQPPLYAERNLQTLALSAKVGRIETSGPD